MYKNSKEYTNLLEVMFVITTGNVYIEFYFIPQVSRKEEKPLLICLN